MPTLPLSLRLTLAWQALVMRAPIGLYSTPPAQQGTSGSFLLGVTDRQMPKRSAQQFLDAYSTIPHLRNVTHRIADSVASQMTAGVHLYAVQGRRGYQRVPELRHGDKDVRLKTLKALKANGELQEIEDHPLLTALRGKNNPLFSGYMIHFLNQLYLDILGEAFLLKDRGGLRFPIAFYPIPPPWIKETPSASDPKYRINYNAYQADVPAPDMLWFKDPDPSNPYSRGSGVAQSLATELDTYEYSSQHIAGWFRNGAVPPAVVAPGDGEGASADQIRAIKQSWLEQLQGLFRKHVPFFSTRKLDVHELAHTFQEQQLIELQNHLRDTVIQTLNIPPEQVGIIENSNRATIEASSYIYQENVVEPRMERQREYYQEWLVPEYEDPEKLFLEFDSPVTEDKDYTLRVAQTFPWALTSDEAREMMDLDPEEGEPVHMVPFNLVPTPTLNDVPGSTALPTTTPVAAMTHTARIDASSSVAQAPRLQAKVLVDAETYQQVHRIADRLIPRLQRRFYEVVIAARNVMDLDVLTHAIERRQATRAEDAIPWLTIQEALREASQQTFTQALLQSGEATATELGTHLGTAVAFNTASPHVAAYAHSQSALLVTRITEPTRQTIRDTIARVFAAEYGETAQTAARQIRDVVGLLPRQAATLDKFRASLLSQDRLTPEQIARRVERVSQSMIRQRAQTIARTELLDAANAGQQMLWEQSAQEQLFDVRRARRFWLLTPDDRLDPHCEAVPEMNPEGVALDQPFETPLGPVMRPTLHQNCRCAVTLRPDAV